MKANRAIALLTVRLVLGFIFAFQGIGKVFKWGIENVYLNSFESYEKYFSEYILYAVTYYTSYVELIAGILLLIGIWRDYALYALATVLVIVSFGHGVDAPIWPLEHVIFRLMLLVTLLLLPKEWDKIQADHFLSYRKGKH